MLVHGTVPEGSGLSSSSALVVAAAIAILGVYGCTAHVPLPAIAKFTCVCERHVGVQSGGMDQAISVMGKLGARCTVLPGHMSRAFQLCR